MITQKPAEELARVFLENQHYLEKVTDKEIHWAIKNGPEAVFLFFEAVKYRARQVVQKTPRDFLSTWKIINVGGVSNEDIFEKLRRRYYLGKWSCYFITNKTFATENESYAVELVVLPLEYFGFSEPVRTDIFLDEKFIAEWSAKNLEGQRLELCFPEDALQLRMQYDDQPCGEILWMGMRPLTDSQGNHRIFCVRRRNHGRRWIDACPARSSACWSLGVRFVFRVRQSKA